jgi:hypothetical protein
MREEADMFDHLDDPHPPRSDAETRAEVAARAERLRRRRRASRSGAGVVVAVVVLGAAAVAVAHRRGPSEIDVAEPVDNCCGTIAGTVTGEGAGARQGVTVMLMFADEVPAAGKSAQPPGTTLAGAPLPDVSNRWRIKSRVYTNQTGHFEFTGLAPGNYVVRYVDPFDPLREKVRFEPAFYPSGEEFSEAKPIAVTNGTTANADVTLVLSPNFGIRGSVHERKVQGTAFPIAKITVRLFRDGELIREAITDANGSYDFGGVDPGSYTVAFVDLEDRADTGGRFATALYQDGAPITMGQNAEVTVDGELVRAH